MTDSEFSILLVDNEPDIVEIFSHNLTKEGYKVYTAKDGLTGFLMAKEYKPHLIVLDVMVPGIDGIELCQQIRSLEYLKNTAIIFVTACSEDYSQIAGYSAGADDYIIKPVKIRVFMHKIKALLKRSYPDNNENRIDLKISNINYPDLEIDKDNYTITIMGKTMSLPNKEFNLLSLLSSKPGKVFSRESIYSYIWGDNVVVSGRSIDVHIRKIREKIGNERIVTIKGVGYKYRES